MVSVWDLFTLMCFAMPFGGALSSANAAKVGLGGYALAISVAAALGLGCAWTMRTVGEKFIVSSGRYSEPRRDWALYLAIVLWLAFAGLLGAWVSSAALRLIT